MSLPSEENARIFREQIAPDYLDACTPQRAPVAVIVVGQTGAGKTAVTRMVKETLDRGGATAWINMDFYNPYHPDYARWQAERPQEADALVRPDGDAWWAQAQDYALARSFNILIESAAVSPAEFEDICRRIQSASLLPGVAPYRIETVFVAVAGPISRLGTWSRFLGELQELDRGRLVDGGVHDASRRGVLRAAAAFEREGLGNYGAVLRRDGTAVHVQAVTAGQVTPENELTLVAAIEHEHARVLTPEEAAQFVARQAAAILLAPDFGLPELDRVAREGTPLLPPPHAPWQEVSLRAGQLRGAAPAAPDPTLLAHTDADVVQLLAHTLTDRHPASSRAAPSLLGQQAVERLLAELARRASLSPDLRAHEERQRQILSTTAHRAITEPGSLLPARPSAAAARSRSTTISRPPGSKPSTPGPAAIPRPADGQQQRHGRSR